MESFAMGKDALRIVSSYLASTSPVSQATLKSHLADWDRYLQRKRGTWERADENDADSFLAELRKRPGKGRIEIEGASNEMNAGTICNRIRTIAKVYTKLLLRGLVRRNPFAEVLERLPRSKTQRHGTNFIEFEHVLPMIQSRTEPRDRALLAAMFGGALRKAEAVGLRVGCLQQTAKGSFYLGLPVTKGGGAAKQPIPEWAAEHIRTWSELRKAAGASSSDFLFPKAGDTSKPLDHSSPNRIFKAAAEAVGLDPRRYSPHSARATACTKLRSDGVPKSDVKQFMRHKTEAMVELYDKRRLALDENPGVMLSFESDKTKDDTKLGE